MDWREIIGVVVLVIVGIIMHGFVLSVLWEWFVVPSFKLPQLTIVPAIGICLLVSFLTYQDIGSSKGDIGVGQAIQKAFFNNMVKPLAVLLIGWLVHLCGKAGMSPKTPTPPA